MKKLALLLVFMLLVSAVQVCAQDFEFEFSAEDFSLRAEGQLGDREGTLFSLSLLDNPGAVSASNVPFYTTACTTGEGGACSVKLLLPQTIRSGKWYVSAVAETERHADSFMVVNPSDSDTKRVLGAVNECEDKEELFDVLSAQSSDTAPADITYLGFDMPANAEDICDVLICELKHLNADADTNAFYHAFRRAEFYCAVSSGSDFDEALKAYADSFDYDCEKLARLDADTKEAFISAFIDSDYTRKGLSVLLADSLFFAELGAMESLGQCEALITDNAEYLEIDMGSGSAYSKIPSSKRYKVFQAIYKACNELKITEDIKELFDETVEDVLDSLEDSGSSGGGSSSSKSSSLPSAVKVDNDYTANIPVSPITEPKPMFNDIDSSFAKTQIEALASDGIINGYEDGSFRPQNNVTRAEFAALIVRALNVEQGGQTAEFADVLSSDWYYSPVMTMSSNGFVNGYNGSFNPDGMLTRQDVAVIIHNVLGDKLSSEGSAEYSDSADISEYAAASVQAITDAGIMSGFENKFRPCDPVTRAETATVISNILNFLSK